ncbi:NADH-quinone oxidoreductase subunit L [Dyadobacter tibetensis]|uniref:NADH-quinone oxidoreductase subunit L n=1 Tax=Dyadobacter tibetensis TaxID=1211851 RepID=UPI00046EEA15|nr:NADH-quinone oxidoreductase subunit L [Dyadobacter tibetensis]
MSNLLWLLPAFPFLGFVLLTAIGKRLSSRHVALIGVGSITLAGIVSLILGISLLQHPLEHYSHTLWIWIDIGNFQPGMGLYVDTLAMVFLFVITVVGALIHVYACEFMEKDPDYSRFMSCMNLFVCAMLLLVMADNFLLLYLGWEGVGLCSYMLIGFWYEKPANGYAARKAFTMTRLGDISLAIGMMYLFYEFNSLNIAKIVALAPEQWALQPQTALIVTLLLLGGALGKSAQFPLHNWLPDAMAGPSPVSALIHAATMVTAGVYLIARMHALFELAPAVQGLIAIIGAVTLLLAGFSALVQYDIKRVLAYSTISQIGYMFLALGVGAWTAAIFHFMVHAFFKALLFLAAGAIIEALHHEHNMFRMGGLKSKLPLIFWTFLIASASLAAVPLLSAGFYSKDQILWYTLAGQYGNPVLYSMALVGALLTAAYTARMMLLVFWGQAKSQVLRPPGTRMSLPLIILALLTSLAGFLEFPHNFFHFTPFSDFLNSSLPLTSVKEQGFSEGISQVLAAVMTFVGAYIAYYFYHLRPNLLPVLKEQSWLLFLQQLWLKGWYFDQLYDFLWVRPFQWITAKNKEDVIDGWYSSLTSATRTMSDSLSLLQSGSLRWYVMGMVLGAILLLSLQILL